MISKKRLESLREKRSFGIGRLLLLARRDFVDQVKQRTAGARHVSLPESWHSLMPYIDVEGTRSTVVAQRAGIAKQHVSKIVRELEEKGLLERAPDPGDGRAFLVRFTELGLQQLLLTHEVIRDIEKDYEALVGTDDFEALRRALSKIAYVRG